MQSKLFSRIIVITLVISVSLLGSSLIGFQRAEAGGKEDAKEKVEPVGEKPAGPKRGGTLVISMHAEPTMLDLCFWKEFPTVWTLDPLNDFLMVFDHEGNFIPRLATGYEIVDDKTIKMQLRRGVKFHNGRELVADDVKKTFDRVMSDPQAATGADYIKTLDYVEVTGDYEFLLHLKVVDPTFLGGLTRVPIVPMEVVEEQGDMKTKPVGCGPFMFDSWDKGAKLTFLRFPDYWDQPKPYVDKLIWLFQPEYGSQISSLKAGDADLVIWLDNKDVVEWKKSPPSGIKVDDGGNVTMTYHYVSFNMRREPFKSNKNLRKAIQYAIDREEMAQLCLFMLGPEKVSWIGENSPYYNPEWEFEHNLELAKEYMVKAGYPDGLKLECIAPKTPLEEPMGQTLKEQLARIGIEVELQVLEVATFVDVCFTQNDFEMEICGGESFPDPAILGDLKLKKDGAWNWEGFYEPEIERMLTEARQSYDFETRKAIYDKVIKWMIEEAAPFIVILDGSRFAGMRERVQGWQPYNADFRYDFSILWLED